MSIPTEILNSIDLMNTLQGGRVEPLVNVKNDTTGYEVIIKLPSVAPDALQVEVVENRLWVYYMLPILSHNIANATETPYTVATLLLPNSVDVEDISAKYIADYWRIFMPHNSQTKGFRRKIAIE